jgi:hypothetical protein
MHARSIQLALIVGDTSSGVRLLPSTVRMTACVIVHERPNVGAQDMKRVGYREVVPSRLNWFKTIWMQQYGRSLQCVF